MSALIVFPIFVLVNGSIAYYCWTVIQRHRRRLQNPDLFQPERERSWFTVIVMWIPLLGFSFEFLYFLYKTLQTLWFLILK